MSANNKKGLVIAEEVAIAAEKVVVGVVAEDVVDMSATVVMADITMETNMEVMVATRWAGIMVKLNNEYAILMALKNISRNDESRNGKSNDGWDGNESNGNDDANATNDGNIHATESK